MISDLNREKRYGTLQSTWFISTQRSLNFKTGYYAAFTPHGIVMVSLSEFGLSSIIETGGLGNLHCKSRPSQYELHIPWKEPYLFAWGRQSSKLVWNVSTKNFCFPFPEICRSNVIVHLRTVISLFDVNYKLLYITIFVC